MKTLVLLSCLIPLSFTLSISAPFDLYVCDRDNRPNLMDCYSKPNIPVCGFSSDNCPFSQCGTDYYNECAACATSNVNSYEIRACQPSEVVNQCYQCDPTLDAASFKTYEPVCGIRQNCDSTKQDCSTTFANACAACAQTSYKWYQNGVCKEDKQTCSNTRPTTCTATTLTSKKVCAAFASPEGYGLAYTTAASSCFACKDKGVQFYTAGACGAYTDNKTFCLPYTKDTVCKANDTNQVCGYFKSRAGDLGNKIVSNACTACNDESIQYYIPGACETKCNRDPRLAVDCGGNIAFVCAKYTVKGVTKYKTVKNGCLACYASSIKYDSYTEGLCPGDKGLSCADDQSGWGRFGGIDPVCGYKTANCTSSTCRTSYVDSKSACTDFNSTIFNGGLCPGDEGVSCVPYRKKGGDMELEYHGMDYGTTGVCGYTKKGCENSSCRQTYNSYWDACGNTKVLFFKDGACPN